MPDLERIAICEAMLRTRYPEAPPFELARRVSERLAGWGHYRNVWQWADGSSVALDTEAPLFPVEEPPPS